MSKILVNIADKNYNKSFTVDKLEENREIIINAKTILVDHRKLQFDSDYDSDDDDDYQDQIVICKDFFESIESLPNCTHIQCEKLRLRRLPQLPICTGVNCFFNELEELPKLPECIGLDCKNNKLRILPDLTKCQYLTCNNQYPGLEALPELPNCKLLSCYDNKLQNLPNLPLCESLICHNNLLRKIPNLPNCRENLICSNQTEGLEELPKILICRVLKCKNNKLKVLPKLPKCEILECQNNKLKVLPELPSCQPHLDYHYVECENNPDLYYPRSVARKFRLTYPSPGNKRHYKEIFNRILNKKRANNAFNVLLEKIRMKPSISMDEERRFRDAIANLDLGEEQEQELKSYIKKLPGIEYEKAMKEAGELGMQVDPRITRIRRTVSSNFRKYYVNYVKK